ncbi:hypothetical protein DFH07DRAFT_822887 [Mycena maculata]|uniref:DUF6593 domain-containing protein n=1 Tax=Mycena maculata TaxID=230809 RepID=A0AAD7J401_9AGAR|nr:hypothetical protein DFH07DRAFT_822887 [Mycena maculata]
MTSLVFDKDSMINTTIQLNLSPAYTVSTRFPGSTTEIRSAGTGTVVGRINRRTYLPDTVAFPDAPNRKAVKISTWLKDAKLADGSPGSVLQLGKESTFLVAHSDYELALFAGDMKTILAHWQPRTGSANRALIIFAGMEKHQTEILAAFLFQEQKIRRRTPMGATTAQAAMTGYMKQ